MKFKNYHPFSLALYFTVILVFTMFVNNPVMLALSLIGAALLSFTLKTVKLAGAAFYVIVFFTVAVTNPLFSYSGSTVLFRAFGRNITLESLCYGAAIGAMLVAVMLWCGCMARVLTNEKLLFLIAARFPKTGLVVSCALRLVPLFLHRFGEIEAAQKALGMYSDNSLKAKLKTLTSVFSTTVASSMESGLDTAAAMAARGYGKKERTSFSLFRFTVADVALTAAVVLLSVITVVGFVACTPEFVYYPSLSEIKLTPIGTVGCGAYALLTLLPFFTELKEAVVWKYSMCKI